MQNQYNWLEVLADFDAKKLSVSKYCQTHGIAETTVYKYLQRRKKQESSKDTSNIKIPMQSVYQLPISNSIAMKNQSIHMKHKNTELTIPENVSAQWLAQLIIEINKSC